MNIVLDTNVLVSGLINPHGLPGRTVDLLRSGLVRTVVDDRILSEYRDVLYRPELHRYFSQMDRDYIVEFLHGNSVRIVSTRQILDLPDPGDAPFLEVSVEAQVPLVSGDARHFPEEKRHGAVVETPSEFISRIAAAFT